MASSPVVEWRNVAVPNAVVTSVALTGNGFSGAIPVGSSSATFTLRLYNNFLAAGSIADALNCALAAYDDTIHQGLAITPPSTGAYVQVQVLDYNGVTSNADAQGYAIGGQTKHPIPTNSGTISGTGSNYVTIQIQIIVPSIATQGSVSQGLWVEYSSTA